MFKLFTENIQNKLKRGISTLFWCIVSVLAFIIIDKIYINEPEIVDTKIYTYEDISTSISESNQLIITDRHTGLYHIYSDSVLIGIHGMYSTYIAKDFQEKTTKK